jgi:glycosyltransferase involved in cell wall biosynthesis
MAMVSLAQGLVANGVDLTIFALNTSKHFVSQEVAREASKGFRISQQYIDNRIKAGAAVWNLLGKDPFHVSRFFSQDVADALSQLLDKDSFDAIVFESVFMTPYLNLVSSKSRGFLVLRSHNIEYLIWERVCKETANPFRKWYLQVQTRRLKSYELKISRKFSLVAAITPIDAATYATFLPTAQVTVVPFGISPVNAPAGLPWQHEGLVIGFLGSMDWMPNEDAVRWFIDEVWPLVLAAGVGVRAIMAGRGMPQDLLGLHLENLSVEGAVTNARDFWARVHLGVVPLRSGSGVRIKVLECMSLGIPVLSTAIGCEGIEAAPNEEILIADDAPSFAKTIINYAMKKAQLQRIGQAATAFIARAHAPEAAAAKLLQDILKSHPST